MSKQVREAAQRIIDFNVRNGQELGDDTTVCRAWLAEHPADDENPVDVEWLISVGFKWSNEDIGEGYLWINNLKSGNKFDLIYLPTSCVWLLSDEINELTLDVRTRGDVRSLAKGLKIELGETR
jgi:hypothetical protein